MTRTQALIAAGASGAMVAGLVLAIVLATRGDDSGERGADLPEGVVPTDSLRTAIAEGTPPTDPEIAENDMSTELPGTFVPSQGRGHFNYTFDPRRTPKPFCEGVASSADPVGTQSVDVPTPESGVKNACYSSNPPSSGWHPGVQRNADLGNGVAINIPPDPDVYPSDAEIPREAIPHILEHAGVFVGYHCADGDAACEAIVEQITDIVNGRIDDHDDRVVLARDGDLAVGMIGLASWTRVDTFPYTEFTEDRVVEFIDVHSCRFDPEGFCN